MPNTTPFAPFSTAASASRSIVAISAWEYANPPPRGRTITMTGIFTRRFASSIVPSEGVNPPRKSAEQSSTRSAPPFSASIASSIPPQQISSRTCDMRFPRRSEYLNHANHAHPTRELLAQSSHARSFVSSSHHCSRRPDHPEINYHGKPARHQGARERSRVGQRHSRNLSPNDRRWESLASRSGSRRRCAGFPRRRSLQRRPRIPAQRRSRRAIAHLQNHRRRQDLGAAIHQQESQRIFRLHGFLGSRS